MAYKEWRLGKGLNLKPSPDLIGEDELLDADGCWFDEPGAVSSEPGPTTFASSLNSGGGDTQGDYRDSVRGIGEGVTEGTRYIFLNNHSSWNRYDFDTGANEVQVAGVATLGSNPTSFVSIREWVYGANAQRFLRYKPTVALLKAHVNRNDNGTGYAVGDILTVAGGTAGTTATLRVKKVDSAGVILRLKIIEPGDYSVLPSSPNSVTGGTGTGADIDLGFSTAGAPILGVVTAGVSKVGCPKPDAPDTPTETGTAGSITGTVYKWVVTYYNGVAESNFSEPLTYTLLADNKNVQFNIPVDSQLSSGTISRRVYRTDNNGTIYYFVGEVPDNTTTIFVDPMGVPPSAETGAAEGDEVRNEPRRKARLRGGKGWWPGGRSSGWSPIYNIRDERFEKDDPRYNDVAKRKGEIIASNLGLLADWTDHDQLVEGNTGELNSGGIRSLIVANDVVYGIVEDEALVFSNSGQPEYYPIWNKVNVGEGYNSDLGTGEKLQVILQMGQDVMCYTDRGLWRFRRQGIDAIQSVLESVDNTVGTPSVTGAVKSEEHGHFFMAKDGIYRYDGRKVSKVSYAIEDLFTDSANADYVDPLLLESCACGTYRDYFLFSYRTTGNSFNTKTIRLDLTGGEPKWSVSQIGYSSFYLDSKGRLLAGDQNDKLYIVDGGGDATSVIWRLQTGYRPVRSSLSGEKPQILWVDANFGGATTTVSLLDPDGNTIDSFTSTASGRQKIKRLLPMGNIYDRISLKVSSTSTAARKMYGWAVATDEASID